MVRPGMPGNIRRAILAAIINDQNFDHVKTVQMARDQCQRGCNRLGFVVTGESG